MGREDCLRNLFCVRGSRGQGEGRGGEEQWVVREGRERAEGTVH